MSVLFDSDMAIDPDAFRVRKRGNNGGDVLISVSTRLDQGRTIADLSFSGGFTVGGSLVDGNYDLLIQGAKIRNQSGVALDGDRNGSPSGDQSIGGSAADRFYRFFGDSNGDRTVGVAEFNRLRNSMGSLAGQAAYDQLFDFENNGIVGTSDFNQFRSRFGRNLPFE